MPIDERELERIAGELGRQAAETLDVELVAQGVLGRLAEAAREARASATQPRPVWRWLAAAAAVALLVLASVVTFRVPQGPPGAAAQLASATLYDLSSEELNEVLDSLGVQAPASAQVAGLDDLDAEQLGELLALLEG